MNTLLNLRSATLAALALSTLGVAEVAHANALFSQMEVDQNRYAVVASPYAGGTLHQLLILKQISNARQCWSESGGGTTINPLLLDFDFTDICGRATDSNGYSVRVGGEDLNWRYSFRVVRRSNELQLLAVPTVDRNAPELLVGRTRGVNQGFGKFFLEPGWKLTERAYQGTSVGHIYLTNDQSLASLNAATLASRPVSTPMPSTPLPSAPVVQPPIVANPSPVVTVNPTPVVTTPKPAVQPPKTKPTQQPRRTLWQRIWRR
jgi:N-acetylmuramoyl-L-alanine amidase